MGTVHALLLAPARDDDAGERCTGYRNARRRAGVDLTATGVVRARHDGAHQHDKQSEGQITFASPSTKR